MIFSQNAGPEQVVFSQDNSCGLKAIIGIYSTALGPALGGTRFYPYETEQQALQDVLNLSRGMAYKNALAGLELGGGKAVIIGDPRTDKSEALLRAYGRAVASLSGRYITACDVGTYVEDMDVVAQECEWVTGRSRANGGAGDSSVLTAYGVFQGMRASAQWLWGADDLEGRHVGIAGVGKVGRHLTKHLLEAGAIVTVTDIDPAAVDRLRAAYPEVQVSRSVETLVSGPVDVYAPCALGGALTFESVDALRAQVVCGAANNQLAHPAVAELLRNRGVLYAPDYLVNAGGVIQVEDERHGFDFERAKAKVSQIFATALSVFELADEQGVSPALAADRLAEERIAGSASRHPVEAA
ncbi:Glu/Leu/Phe/Val family dehydrogenase [Terrabacter terrigena]|uniref:Glu/Leu/Phe/Val dehydrogenase n=1 Tax=Terrabacter terrigena TaxID=574718 RepID=A0ABW3MS04_9MICO